jgi:hypothetical protein
LSTFTELSSADKLRHDITTLVGSYVDEYRVLSKQDKVEFIGVMATSFETMKVLLTSFDDAPQKLTNGKILAGNPNESSETREFAIEKALRKKITSLNAVSGNTAEKTLTRKFCILYCIRKLSSASGVPLDKLFQECHDLCLFIKKPSLNADLNKLSGKGESMNAFVVSAGRGKYKVTDAGLDLLNNLASELGYSV